MVVELEIAQKEIERTLAVGDELFHRLVEIGTPIVTSHKVWERILQ